MQLDRKRLSRDLKNRNLLLLLTFATIFYKRRWIINMMVGQIIIFQASMMLLNSDENKNQSVNRM